MQTTLTAAVLGMSLCAAAPPLPPESPPASEGAPPQAESGILKIAEDEDELLKLLKQRHNAAVQELQAARAMFNAGVASFDHVFEAAQHVTRSKLALSQTHEDRIAVWEKQVALAKTLEGQLKLLRDQGLEGGSAAGFARAQYFRIDAEVELLRLRRAKSSTGSSAK